MPPDTIEIASTASTSGVTRRHRRKIVANILLILSFFHNKQIVFFRDACPTGPSHFYLQQCSEIQILRFTDPKLHPFRLHSSMHLHTAIFWALRTCPVV